MCTHSNTISKALAHSIYRKRLPSSLIGKSNFCCQTREIRVASYQKNLASFPNSNKNINMHLKHGNYLINFFFPRAAPEVCERSHAMVELELRWPAYATATATLDLSCVCNLTIAHSNARYLTHWVKPEIKPETSWFLVGFISTALQWGRP